MGEDVDKAHVESYRELIKEASKEGPLVFQQWFCKSESLEETRVRGFWDFSVHILTPKVVAHLSNPEDKTVLEIGYGGGRILNAASEFFGKVIGVDIHNDPTAELFLSHKTNITLLTGNGKDVPVESNTVDFVYSFIVFMHLQSFDTFVSYLKETHRVLRKNGVAQIYFGLADKEYQYHKAPPNHASLNVSMMIAQEEAKKSGFEIIDSGRSYKRVPNGYPDIIGQQGYITLKPR